MAGLGCNLNAEDFIARWQGGVGGQERANYAMFLVELCDLLHVARPHQATADHGRNDYVFERRVSFSGIDGPEGSGRMDLYKRGAFICECKQSRRPDGAKRDEALNQLTFEGLATAAAPAKGRADAGWDALMKAARYQAARYVRALPVGHPAPPFLIVCDIGRCLELYADFSGTGRHYELFPDRRGYRIFLDDLRRPETREMLRRVWDEPDTLDPSQHAAVVTRDIAARLAKVTQTASGLTDVTNPKRQPDHPPPLHGRPMIGAVAARPVSPCRQRRHPQQRCGRTPRLSTRHRCGQRRGATGHEAGDRRGALRWLHGFPSPHRHKCQFVSRDHRRAPDTKKAGGRRGFQLIMADTPPSIICLAQDTRNVNDGGGKRDQFTAIFAASCSRIVRHDVSRTRCPPSMSVPPPTSSASDRVCVSIADRVARHEL